MAAQHGEKNTYFKLIFVLLGAVYVYTESKYGYFYSTVTFLNMVLHI